MYCPSCHYRFSSNIGSGQVECPTCGASLKSRDHSWALAAGFLGGALAEVLFYCGLRVIGVPWEEIAVVWSFAFGVIGAVAGWFCYSRFRTYEVAATKL